MDDILNWLQDWYMSQCDEDWEHQYGVCIDTIDNPGWRLSISLNETGLEYKEFENFEIERTKTDWIHCFIRNQCFEAACSVSNLSEAIKIFRNWAES